MALSQAFILNRLQKTVAVATSVAGEWDWDTKSAAELDAFKSTVEGQLDTTTAAEANALGKRGELDVALDALGKNTLKGVGLARNKFGKDRSKAALLSRLSARGDSRQAQRREAEVFAKVWAELDADWEPIEGMTLASYQQQRLAIEGNDKSTPPTQGLVDFYEKSNIDWRKEARRSMSCSIRPRNIRWAGMTRRRSSLPRIRPMAT